MTIIQHGVKSDQHCIHGIRIHNYCHTCALLFRMGKDHTVKRFERIEELGLAVFSFDEAYVRAEDLERVLGEGKPAWASLDAIKGTPIAEVWYGDNPRGHTHTGLLINIKPIAKPDTADELLREVASKLIFGAECDLMKRVREYLGRKA